MVNETYSFKDFSGQSFTGIEAAEFNNTTIKGSCFYQENEPNSDVFPSEMTGVTFEGCNLDNVSIPSGNTVNSSCCTRKMQVQEDGLDWLLDDDLNTISVI